MRTHPSYPALPSANFLPVSLALAVTLSASFLPGCKEGDTGGLGADEAPEAIARAVCELYFDCDCTNFNDHFTSIDACRPDQEAEVQEAIDEGEAAGLTYDADCVAELLAAYEQLGCATQGSITPAQYAEIVNMADCKMFHGDIPAGQPCTPLTQSNGDDCAKGIVCDETTMICTVPEHVPVPGEACATEYTSACAGEAVCIDLDGDGMPACEPLPAAGGTCLGALNLCNTGLACDQTDKSCEPAPAAGQPCAMAPLPHMQCAADSVCDGTTCQLLPGGGEPCVNGRCAPGFACNAMSICAAEAPLVCELNADDL